MNEKKLPQVRKISELGDIRFPENPNLKDSEKSRIEDAIMKGSIVNPKGRLFLNKRNLPNVLATDKKGANKVYNNSQEDDKFENGDEQYLSTSQVRKEVDERLQQPRGALEREKLKHSGNCLDTIRESPTLVSERLIQSDRIRQERPKLTKRVIKDESIETCELSGEEFENDAEAHHIERVCDDPLKALDNDNLIVVKKEIHGDIHKNNLEGQDGLEEYADKKGYKLPNRLKKGK
jgi:hypothetical protein